MGSIRVQTDLAAPPDRVWADIRDITSHVEWMEDAVALRLTSEASEGVGVTFDCDTKVGPLRLTDRMEITEWTPEKVMGVRHVGLVTGAGFTLEDRIAAWDGAAFDALTSDRHISVYRR